MINIDLNNIGFLNMIFNLDIMRLSKKIYNCGKVNLAIPLKS